MKILFTILSIKTKNNFYLNATKRLINELLNNTNHDILLTTNDEDYFSDIISKRLHVRNNLSDELILKYQEEFNYNLKFLSFKNLPKGYDVIFYIDGDISNKFWSDVSENKIEYLMENYDYVATRLNCILKNEVDQFITTGHALFKHKILSYDILSWDKNDDLLFSKLPSEHFLIFKYDEKKLNLFSQKWEELNKQLQDKNGGDGSWGDGFEIGISSRFAGYCNEYDLPYNELPQYFGFIFNGNKI